MVQSCGLWRSETAAEHDAYLFLLAVPHKNDGFYGLWSFNRDRSSCMHVAHFKVEIADYECVFMCFPSNPDPLCLAPKSALDRHVNLKT